MTRSQAKRGTYVDPSSPDWHEATARAQASIALLRELHASGRAPVWVKYPLTNAKGETEHVWGELQQIDDILFRATLETPLIGGAPSTSPPYELGLSALEDWQVEMPDGSIRGGFTTQVEIAMARKNGRHVPSHAARMEGRFVDI